MEVLLDRIWRENGIEHLLTQPRSPTTTTGKIERFHRTVGVARHAIVGGRWRVEYGVARPNAS